MLTGLSSPCGFASSAWLGVATDKTGATVSEWSGRSGAGGDSAATSAQGSATGPSPEAHCLPAPTRGHSRRCIGSRRPGRSVRRRAAAESSCIFRGEPRIARPTLSCILSSVLDSDLGPGRCISSARPLIQGELFGQCLLNGLVEHLVGFVAEICGGVGDAAIPLAVSGPQPHSRLLLVDANLAIRGDCRTVSDVVAGGDLHFDFFADVHFLDSVFGFVSSAGLLLTRRQYGTSVVSSTAKSNYFRKSFRPGIRAGGGGAERQGDRATTRSRAASPSVKDQARALEASAKATNGQGALPASACSTRSGLEETLTD